MKSNRVKKHVSRANGQFTFHHLSISLEQLFYYPLPAPWCPNPAGRAPLHCHPVTTAAYLPHSHGILSAGPGNTHLMGSLRWARELPSLPWASPAWVYPLGNSARGLIYLIQTPRVFLHWGCNLFQVTYPLRVGMAGCGRGEWLHYPNKVQRFSFYTGQANSQPSLNPHHFKHWVPPYFFNSRPRGFHQLKKISWKEK